MRAIHTTWMSSKQTYPINLLSDGLLDACGRFNTICVTIPGTMSDSINISNPKATPKAILRAIRKANSDHSHLSSLLQEGGLPQWLCDAVHTYLKAISPSLVMVATR
jgi:hypothetical protein